MLLRVTLFKVKDINCGNNIDWFIVYFTQFQVILKWGTCKNGNGVKKADLYMQIVAVYKALVIIVKNNREEGLPCLMWLNMWGKKDKIRMGI